MLRWVRAVLVAKGDEHNIRQVVTMICVIFVYAFHYHLFANFDYVFVLLYQTKLAVSGKESNESAQKQESCSPKN